jgi:hypothetical protein
MEKSAPAPAAVRAFAKRTRAATLPGDACVRPTLASPKKVCGPPQAALTKCSDDNGCDTAKGEVCCKLYKEPVCVPSNQCPTACNSSSECDTENGQTCCTTLGITDTTLAAQGLCVNTDRVFCPKACTTSSDCDTVKGELCCDGQCGTSCVKTCKTSGDCSGQICCKTRVARSVWYHPQLPKPGYDACKCSGSETKCSGDKALKACENDCSWKLSSCDDFCKTLGLKKGGSCSETGGSAECKCCECAPGEKQCAADGALKICQADCSWNVQTCPHGCDSGACNACTPGDAKCLSETMLEYCDGTKWDNLDCESVCKADPRSVGAASPACRPNPSNPGSDACFCAECKTTSDCGHADALGTTCNADGACACANDGECAGKKSGGVCLQTSPRRLCGCKTSADCPAGETCSCQLFGPSANINVCSGSAHCPS